MKDLTEEEIMLGNTPGDSPWFDDWLDRDDDVCPWLKEQAS